MNALELWGVPEIIHALHCLHEHVFEGFVGRPDALLALLKLRMQRVTLATAYGYTKCP